MKPRNWECLLTELKFETAEILFWIDNPSFHKIKLFIYQGQAVCYTVHRDMSWRFEDNLIGHQQERTLVVKLSILLLLSVIMPGWCYISHDSERPKIL